MENTEMLYELCEMYCKWIEKAKDKLRKSGTDISASDADYLDKLTHSLKSIKCIIPMMEDEEPGYSSARSMYDGGVEEGRANRSYARGRDSMGRYTSRSRGYSRHGEKEDMIESLREIMESTSDEQDRKEVQKLIQKMERM